MSPLLLDYRESALAPAGGFGNSCDNAAAGHRWTSLLQLHPESTRELLFRLPWYTSDLSTESSLHPPYISEGRPSSWIVKVVCKAVPLDMTWREIASALNGSTPIVMGNSYFTASGRILSPFKTLRESNVVPFTTIHTHERILGGGDGDDSDSSSDEDHDNSVSSDLPPVPQPTTTVGRFIAAISSPFVASASEERVEFSPAVESPSPTSTVVPSVVEQGGENADDGTLSPPRVRSDSGQSDDSSDSATSLGRIIQDSRRGLLADDNVQAHHLTEGAGDMPVEPERVVAINAPPPPTYILWDQFVADGSVPPAFAASGLTISDDEFRIMFPEGGMPVPGGVRTGEPMFFPGKPTHHNEAAIGNRVQGLWRRAQQDEVRIIEQRSEADGWFVDQGSSSEPPADTPFPNQASMGPAAPPGSTVVNGITHVPLPARFSGAPTSSVVRGISRRSRPRARDSVYASQFERSPTNPRGAEPNSSGSGDSDQTPRGLLGGRQRRPGGSRTADTPPMKWEDSSPPPPPPPAAGVMIAPTQTTSFQKLRATFKLKPFSGRPAEWKVFDDGLERYATIHGLGAVMSEDYTNSEAFNFDQNQMFYYALQEALLGAPQALGFFKTAAKWDGNGAYTAVHRAYTFMGPTTAALLLKKLTNLRFRSSETPAAFVMRLVELFDELEAVPGDAAQTFNDVQKIGYLQTALAHEPSMKYIHMHIQTNLTRGKITFLEACTDLYAQCDDSRAQEILTNGGSGTKPTRALISTAAKGHRTKNKSGLKVDKNLPCIVEGCSEKRHRGLCQLHFTQLGAGKVSSLQLRNSWGSVSWDSSSDRVKYPSALPADRHPGGTKA